MYISNSRQASSIERNLARPLTTTTTTMMIARTLTTATSRRGKISAIDLTFLRSIKPRSALATRSLSRSQSSTTTLQRYGLGGQHWKQFDPSAYQNLIYDALTGSPSPTTQTQRPQIDYFEIAGPDGGEIAMVGAIQSALERLESSGVTSVKSLSPITITTRIGYRSTSSSTSNSVKEDNNKSFALPATMPLPGDVILSTSDEEESSTLKKSTYNMPADVVHNVHPQYVLDTVKSSTLWELQQEKALRDKLRFVFLLHNPEAQIVELLRDEPNATYDDRQEFLKQRLTPAMEALQEFCSSDSKFASSSTAGGASLSFGVVSNGLGIPRRHNHPMQLDSDLIVQSSSLYDNLSTVHLPANLLEVHGWDVARALKTSCPNIEVDAIRPLSAYPDLGTGDSYPFRLVDYSLPSLEKETIQPSSSTTGLTDGTDASRKTSKPFITAKYTNEMNGIPVVYQMALQAAMSHFDAEPLLEAKLERELTTEERETLDGCKLVQSMIHDLDAQLKEIRSFAKHEDELYGKIIPLLYDTFEAMDDQTSDVLQAYFAAYAVAVRYAIARKTRDLLKSGEHGTKGESNKKITYPDIPQEMTLQEYALRRMLSEDCFDRIIMGSSTMQDFHHQTYLMEIIQSEEGSPMDCIRHHLRLKSKDEDDGKIDEGDPSKKEI